MKNVVVLFVYICMFGITRAQVADTSYLSATKTELNKVWPKNRLVNVVFHGHSGPAGYWTNHEVHTLESYPHMVMQALKKKYPYAVINVIVTAIGGENSMKGATRFESEVLTHHPDVLLIDYAVNDRFAGLEKPKAAWEQMIQQAQEKGVEVILITPSPDQRLDILAPNDLEKHADQVRELASKYHTGLADPYAVFKKIAKDGGNIKDYMSHVNHCNEKGHAIVAAEIMKWF